jgi:hypothetical protein
MNNLTKFTLFFLLGVGSTYLYFKKFQNDTLEGGKGDDLEEDDVDPRQLEMGLQVEMEHTRSKKIAKEIALDHLAEDPEYYTKLKKIHKENPEYEDEEEED